MPAVLDPIDRQIMRLTQAGLPLTPKPYHAISEQLGLSPENVQQRMQAMLDKGVIRRIAAVPNHYRLGYRCNGMSVWDVDDEMVDILGGQVGRLDFVSHCYQRPRHLPLWPYNLFAMVHAKSEAEVEAQIEQIATLLGAHCRARDILYSSEILKKTGFRSGKGD